MRDAAAWDRDEHESALAAWHDHVTAGEGRWRCLGRASRIGWMRELAT
jgi:hypothetical protein